MMQLPPGLEAETAELAARFGPTLFLETGIPDGLFEPVDMMDRVGEVCMVIRRPNGRLLAFRKDIYPQGVFRLLTGGINHGEGVEAALLREVAEETSLTVALRRLLAVIGYRAPQTPASSFDFYTFAFLLDELSGTLAPQDPEERVEAYRDVEPSELAELAVFLETLEDRTDRAIGGSWRSWGIFRAIVHRTVAAQLAAGGGGAQPSSPSA
jgi:ADP-ribose pyrophosphatase YjhB (NUDIX family)